MVVPDGVVSVLNDDSCVEDGVAVVLVDDIVTAVVVDVFQAGVS